jgi:predicted phage-related endonuclease
MTQADRQHRLNATEMVTLYGVSPYQGASEHQVYLDHVHPEASKATAERTPLWMRLGNVIEPLALKFLAEETGQTLRRSRTRVCESHPWLRARPDALVVADRPEEDVAKLLRRSPLGQRGARREQASAVCEAKFVSDPRMAQLWISARPRPPLYVHVQAQVEMTACGLKRACGIGIVMGNPYIWELDHDAELEEEILTIGQSFLKDHVQAEVPPSWDGSKAANRLLMARWPTPDETFRKADLNMHGMARTYLDLDAKIEALQKEQAIVEQALKEIIGDRTGLLGDGWKATWKAPRMGYISWKDVAHDVAGRKGVPSRVIDKHRSPPTRRFKLFERNAQLVAAGLASEDMSLEDLQEAVE